MTTKAKPQGLCSPWLIVILLLPLLMLTWGEATGAPPPPKAGETGTATTGESESLIKPQQLPVNAESAVLIDAATGQVLAFFNPHTRIAPASFAKLLTLHVVFDAIKQGRIGLDDDVYVSKKAWSTGGSRMFIEVDTKVSLRNIITGIAVVSGNDASVAAAEYSYGTTEAFAKAMNETAQAIGMRNSHFTNPHGLPDDEQYTTAYDMALLARSYVENFPEALTYHSMPDYTYANIQQRNRNGLLRKDSTVDGLKTGYIAEAGYHLLATARRDSWRLIAVVMGAKSPAVREAEALKLLSYGYRNFEHHPFFSKGEVLAELPVWKGKRRTLPVVFTADVVAVIPREDKERLHYEHLLPREVTAPLQQGQRLGETRVLLGTETLTTVPIVAAQAVEKAGFFKLIYQNLYLLGRNHKKTLLVLGGVLPLALFVMLISLHGRRRRRKPGLRL